MVDPKGKCEPIQQAIASVYKTRKCGERMLASHGKTPRATRYDDGFGDEGFAHIRTVYDGGLIPANF